MPHSQVQIGKLHCGRGLPLVVIAGPCVIDNRDTVFEIAERLKTVCDRSNIGLIFKASYDKANRSSLDAYRGVGLEKGLEILAEIKGEFQVPVTTDIHHPEQASPVGEVCDLIQIPAFLARQTDLLVAAAKAASVVNVKKGQFMAPWDMTHVIEKLEGSGCSQIMLTERGSFFGYGNLVNDMKALPELSKLGVPVVFDATHSVQQRNAGQSKTIGNREFVEPLAKSAVAMGCDAVFIETHTNPETSPSDAANMLPLDRMENLIHQLQQIHSITHS
ncbi:MAG: 3-deoxy-8-phosphooctulonate synthase [Planctomycetota bacterium]